MDFMPHLCQNLYLVVSGSGMHCNLSLFKNGENAFVDPRGDLELSETAYQFIAGVIKHANELHSSYKTQQ